MGTFHCIHRHTHTHSHTRSTRCFATRSPPGSSPSRPQQHLPSQGLPPSPPVACSAPLLSPLHPHQQQRQRPCSEGVWLVPLCAHKRQRQCVSASGDTTRGSLTTTRTHATSAPSTRTTLT